MKAPTRAYRSIVCILLMLAFLPVGRAGADTKAGESRWFRETGHTLAYVFREFFDRHGGLSIFGLPLTEVFVEDGRPVQYFERARLEWHATLGIVQAGHLGRWAAEQQQQHPAFRPVERSAVSDPAAGYFAETGHSLRGEFKAYWQAQGGLAVFGFPLSEELVERNPQDGNEYVVQYFERARFELHPELPPAYRVLLGHLGRQYLAQHEVPGWALERVKDAQAAWNGVRPTRVAVERVGLDTEVTEAGFSAEAWDVPRYTADHYWPVSAYPGTAGNITIAGHVGYKDTIFSQLPEVRVGDEILVYVGDRRHRYVVTEVLTVLPNETWAMLPTPKETLTLITCVPIGVYSHRLIVRAKPVP